jgi:hypothetical protein
MLAAALVVGAGACKKSPDALLLLEVRSSGPLVAPVARVRFSLPDRAGWPSHVVGSDLGAGGLKFGYYVPGGAPVTVLGEALDGKDCVLGQGTLTFPATAGGAVSQPMTLFVRALPSSGCAGDGGVDANPPPDGGGDGPPGDATLDGPAGDASSDAPAESSAPLDADSDTAEAG